MLNQNPEQRPIDPAEAEERREAFDAVSEDRPDVPDTEEGAYRYAMECLPPAGASDAIASAYCVAGGSFGIGRADAQTASQLETRVGEALLLIARTGFDPAGRPIEYSRIQIRTDRYRHTITLRRKS